MQPRMTSQLAIALTAAPEPRQRLVDLQATFSQACNALAPIAAQQRCWNRVALHHLAYRALRERFPALGSQMACNAIYSVSRTARLVYQHPRSPCNLSRLGDQPLPVLHFLPTAPVYFDRHTLSLKNGRLSMFTLDGRLHFDLGLSDEAEHRFREEKLREVVLSRRGELFHLTFAFGAAEPAEVPAAEAPAAVAAATAGTAHHSDWPDYIVVQQPHPADVPAALLQAATHPSPVSLSR